MNVTQNRGGGSGKKADDSDWDFGLIELSSVLWLHFGGFAPMKNVSFKLYPTLKMEVTQ